MVINKNRKIIQDRLPKPTFKTIEDLDRTRNLMLGLPVLKKSRTIPFGYRISETNLLYILPIQEEMELLVDAKNFLAISSLKEVSVWLTAKTGRPISHEGLSKIMKERRPDDRIKTLTEDERSRI